MPQRILLLQITLQALSSLAIAGGLVYAAVQFRSTRKAQLVTNFSKLVELQYNLRYLRVQDPSLASAYAPENRPMAPRSGSMGGFSRLTCPSGISWPSSWTCIRAR